MCGEHALGRLGGLRGLGSSPHVRGTLAHLSAGVADRGIIPACAGNTDTTFFIFRTAWDHPRMCGEHNAFNAARLLLEGSSPHVRGTPAPCCRAESCEGIIPACAGNTGLHRRDHERTEDHPRMCGEHRGKPFRWSDWQGSSPHVRGTLRSSRLIASPPGIIPACAGNTGGIEFVVFNLWDHPRMCGEHSPTLAAGLNTMGSSPHVRGTQQKARNKQLGKGIIPACAGNTLSVSDCITPTGDHPRMCGEHSTVALPLLMARGSSPHVRGTLKPQRHGLQPPGIIPACAGNTPFSNSVNSKYRDHPRMCGEHSSKA